MPSPRPTPTTAPILAMAAPVDATEWARQEAAQDAAYACVARAAAAPPPLPWEPDDAATWAAQVAAQAEQRAASRRAVTPWVEWALAATAPVLMLLALLLVQRLAPEAWAALADAAARLNGPPELWALTALPLLVWLSSCALRLRPPGPPPPAG
jgi:hypothetical protein